MEILFSNNTAFIPMYNNFVESRDFYIGIGLFYRWKAYIVELNAACIYKKLVSPTERLYYKQ